MNNLDKILNIVKKTGDKIVVTDNNGDFNFVIVPFSDYEKIVENQNNIKELTENELLYKINRDIALWKENRAGELNDDWEKRIDSVKSHWKQKNKVNFYDKDSLHNDSYLKDYDDQFDFDEEDYELWNEKGEPVISNSISSVKSTDMADGQLSEKKEPKYEDIPSPPDIIMPPPDIIAEKREPIIDMSFENDDQELCIQEEPISLMNSGQILSKAEKREEWLEEEF